MNGLSLGAVLFFALFLVGWGLVRYWTPKKHQGKLSESWEPPKDNS